MDEERLSYRRDISLISLRRFYRISRVKTRVWSKRGGGKHSLDTLLTRISDQVYVKSVTAEQTSSTLVPRRENEQQTERYH